MVTWIWLVWCDFCMWFSSWISCYFLSKQEMVNFVLSVLFLHCKFEMVLMNSWYLLSIQFILKGNFSVLVLLRYCSQGLVNFPREKHNVLGKKRERNKKRSHLMGPQPCSSILNFSWLLCYPLTNLNKNMKEAKFKVQIHPSWWNI